MTQFSVQVQTIRSIMEPSFVYLETFDQGGTLSYLQSIRTGILKKRSATGNPEDHTIAQQYHAMLRFNVSKLVNQLAEPFTAVVSPPSRFPLHSEPYRRGVIEKFENIVDLTDRFQRFSAVSSGDNATLDEIYNSLTYQPLGHESRIESLLIVDDVFSRGITAGAIISKLQDAGLPESCRITIACPLWLPRKQ